MILVCWQDASCVLFDAEGQFLTSVYFGNLSTAGCAALGNKPVVTHSGDNRNGAGEGDDETIQVHLSEVWQPFPSPFFPAFHPPLLSDPYGVSRDGVLRHIIQWRSVLGRAKCKVSHAQWRRRAGMCGRCGVQCASLTCVSV